MLKTYFYEIIFIYKPDDPHLFIHFDYIDIKNGNFPVPLAIPFRMPYNSDR